MRCRLCDITLARQSFPKGGITNTEHLCGQCGHVCEMFVIDMYRYYYTRKQNAEL